MDAIKNPDHFGVTVNALDLLRLMRLANVASGSASNDDAQAYTRIMTALRNATPLDDKAIHKYVTQSNESE